MAITGSGLVVYSREYFNKVIAKKGWAFLKSIKTDAKRSSIESRYGAYTNFCSVSCYMKTLKAGKAKLG